MFSKILTADRSEVAGYGVLVDGPRTLLRAEDGRELARIAAVAAAIAEHNRRVQVTTVASPCGDREAGAPSWRRSSLFGVS